MICIKKISQFLILSQMMITPVWAQQHYQNGVWAYDAVYSEDGKRIGISPGLYSNAILDFNQNASPDHKITEVFSYGGSIKMACKGSGGSSISTPCDDANVNVVHNNFSTSAYYNALNKIQLEVNIMPIVDGVIGGDNLSTFNTLDDNTARFVADKVAKLYCDDNLVNGVEFDLEPFNIDTPGQYAFYLQIAKDFAGKHNPSGSDPYFCVNSAHPKGRYFAVFATGAKVNARLAVVLNTYNNGVVIGPLYSLIKYTGEATPPPIYRKYIDNEVKRMIKNANTYNVKFQFGIPASATIEEFEYSNNKASGFQQLDYVKEAMNSIELYARSQSNFTGVDLWGFSARRIKSSTTEFKPSIPPDDVLFYLQNKL